MEFFKSYVVYNEANEKDKPKGPKVIWTYETVTLDEIKQKNQEAYNYVMKVTEILKTDPDYAKIPIIKMNFNKKAQIGLSKEDADKLVASFQADTEIKFGKDEFNLVYIEEKSFSELLKDNVKLNNSYKESEAALNTWNTNNASQSFLFDNKKSEEVLNPEVANKALEDLKNILIKYNAIVKNVEISFVGHTSTIPVKDDPNGNQKISEARSQCIKNMLLNVYPDAKNFNITSIGVGDTQPLYPDDKKDKEKQAKNRRVEVKIKTDLSGGKLPEEFIKYNVIVYGFSVTEMDEQQKPTGHTHVKKKFNQKLNKGKIPCPNFMHG